MTHRHFSSVADTERDVGLFSLAQSDFPAGAQIEWHVVVPGRVAFLFVERAGELPCYFLGVHNFDLSVQQVALACSTRVALSARLGAARGRGVGLICGDFNFTYAEGYAMARQGKGAIRS